MQRLAGAILHFFWQGALVALLTAIALQLLERRSAQSRYAVCVAGLVFMAVAPFATFTFYQVTGRTAERALAIVSQAISQQGRSASVAGMEFWAQWIVVGWCAG